MSFGLPGSIVQDVATLSWTRNQNHKGRLKLPLKSAERTDMKHDRIPWAKWRGYQAAGGRAWITLHDKFVRYVESVRPEVLFFGDGFVEQWRGTHSGHSASAFENHKDAWIKTSEDLGLGEIGLFGICGDGIGNLMWRILDGEMPVTWAPRVVLLSIGTSDMQTWGRRYLQHVNPGYLGSQFEQLVSHILEMHEETRILLLTQTYNPAIW
eukprot:jgi/Botrbrau1/13494/Bobra.0082s0089.2